jgi:aspartate racemase
MTNATRTVGVLGGMGPAATVEFLRRLIARTPASHDEDHLHVLIDSNPQVPERSEAILHGGPDPTEVLCAMARGLETAGAEILAIPCNTAHHYLSSMRGAVGIPVLDMIAETVARLPGSRTGLLATTATIRVGLYHAACDAAGLQVLAPDREDQAVVTGIVDAIKAGRAPGTQRRRLERVADRLVDRGADSILVGCTEISLVRGSSGGRPWIDALDCLVDATLREAGVDRRREDG